MCVNLLDEAKKKKIEIDLEKLSKLLGVPVVGTIATKKKTLDNLKNSVLDVIEKPKNDVDEMSEKEEILERAEKIANEVVIKDEKGKKEIFDRKVDKVLTSKKYGIPIMILMLACVFWITIIGANYPSKLLSWIFSFGKKYLLMFCEFCLFPDFLKGILVDGVYFIGRLGCITKDSI